MSIKYFCLLPRGQEISDLGDCEGHLKKHKHLTRKAAEEELALGLVERLRAPVVAHGRVRQRGVLRRIGNKLHLRGLSCWHGEPLTLALADRSQRDWASTMLAEIQCRRETPSTPG